MPQIKKWLVFQSSYLSFSSFYSAKGVNALSFVWRLQPTVKEYDSIIHLTIKIHPTTLQKRLLHERKIFYGFPLGSLFYDHCFSNKKVNFPEQNVLKDNDAE